MDIELLNIVFEDGEVISLNKNEYVDFYIGNIKDDGEEVNYEPTVLKDKFYANLCFLKINKVLLENYKRLRIMAKKDIVELQVVFSDNKFVKFDVASNANPFSDSYCNELEYVYEDDNNLGILLSEYDLKFKNNLFI